MRLKAVCTLGKKGAGWEEGGVVGVRGGGRGGGGGCSERRQLFSSGNLLWVVKQ